RQPAHVHRTGRESLSQHLYSEHRRRRFPASTRLLSLSSRPRRTSTRSRTTIAYWTCLIFGALTVAESSTRYDREVRDWLETAICLEAAASPSFPARCWVAER